MQKKSKQVWKIVHLVHLSRVHAAKVMLMNSQQKQQKPTCSFSGASISGCTINVYQGATKLSVKVVSNSTGGNRQDYNRAMYGMEEAKKPNPPP